MPVNLYYPGAACPDCQEPIEDDAEEGDACENCGHVFTENHENDDGPDEPEEGDYTTRDHRKFYQYGKLVLDLAEDADHCAEVRKHMTAGGFFPDVWFVSDHGNCHRIDMTES